MGDVTWTTKAMLQEKLDIDKRAQRVGEVVLSSGLTREWCEKHARDLKNARGSMTLTSPAYGRALDAEIAFFDALAVALRGEP